MERDRTRTHRKRGLYLLGLSPLGMVTLLAITAVLVVVSLPRLHGFAVRENERDALLTAQLLARALGEHSDAPPESVAALVAAADLQRQLADADYLADGQLLRRHGYLFRFATLAPGMDLPPTTAATVLAAAPAGSAPRPVVVAWPWAAPRTGREVLVASPEGRVWSHPNPVGTWSGPGDAPPVDADAGWRPR